MKKQFRTTIIYAALSGVVLYLLGMALFFSKAGAPLNLFTIFPVLVLLSLVLHLFAANSRAESRPQKISRWIASEIDKALKADIFIGRALQIVLAGFSIALLSLVAVIAFATFQNELQVGSICIVACAFGYAVSLDSIFKDRGLFAFISLPTLVGVISVTMAGISAGMPISYIFPLAIFSSLPFGLGFLVACFIWIEVTKLVVDAVGGRSKGNTDDPFRVELPEPLDSIRNWMLGKIGKKPVVAAVPVPAE